MACSSLSSYEKEDLHGHWKNDNWEMVFNEDGSMKLGKDGQFQKGDFKYRPFGNTLEITRNGKVFLSNLTVKGIEGDKLSLEFRDLIGGASAVMDDLQVLNRVK